jgi:hypothetical protein
MASPSLTWKKHTSPTSGGATKTEITMGTVTANAWSTAICYNIEVAVNGVQNFRLWMNDSTAIVNGTAISLGSATKTWGIRGTTTTTLAGTTSFFASKGGAWGAATSLAADFKAAPNNSVGAGKAMGYGTSVGVSTSSVSKYAFLSIKPHVSAYDGEHTGFTYQVGYDFS